MPFYLDCIINNREKKKINQKLKKINIINNLIVLIEQHPNYHYLIITSEFFNETTEFEIVRKMVKCLLI